jgi:hypothetical protein
MLDYPSANTLRIPQCDCPDQLFPQATVLDTHQEVVVKVVWPDADLDPEDAKNESPGQFRKDAFKREIEMMRRVGTHPNIIGVLGATADSTVIVFEEALTDLHVIIKKQKRSLSLPILRRCIRDILQVTPLQILQNDAKPRCSVSCWSRTALGRNYLLLSISQSCPFVCLSLALLSSPSQCKIKTCQRPLTLANRVWSICIGLR